MDNKEKNINILNYWIDIESSTPPTIKTSNFTNKGDSKWNQTISFLYKDDLLWKTPLSKNIEKPQNWVHKIFLGIFNTKYVIEEFSSEDLTEIKSTYDTCLVSFLVDGDGYPIKDSIKVPDYLKSIAITTLKNEENAKLFDIRIQDLYATWVHNIKHNKQKLSTEDILEFLQKIVIELKWDLLANNLNNEGFKSLAYSESINLEKIPKGTRPKFDTNDITSSLIVEDLKTIKKNIDFEIISNPFKKYLSEEIIENKKDVIKNKDYFKNGLDIDKLPLACWPFSNESPMVSSQQFAVNTFFDKIEEEHLLSVNGPPGTGKTTILKDIVANIIFKRAEQIIKFKNNPEKAFKEVGETSLQINSKNIQKIYSVDSSISGYEIVIASSNNGSVENITKELPRKTEIAEKYREDFEYIKSISSSVNDCDSWGLISASLGNKKNNYNFYSNFLYSQPTNEGSGQSIFDFLKNPNFFLEKRVYWEDACEDFEKAVEKVNTLKRRLKTTQKNILNIEKIQEKTIKQKKVCEKINQEIKSETNRYKKIKTTFKKIQADYIILNKELKKIENSIIKTEQKIKDKKKEINNKKTLFAKRKQELELSSKKITKLKKDFMMEKSNFEKNKLIFSKTKEDFIKYAKNSNQEIPLDSFWEQGYTKIQKSSPWHSKELNEARVNVFIASMNLQKAFVIENSKYLISNLNAFKQVLNKSFYEDEKLTRSVWETVFLILPIISTTYSSFDNLFGELISSSIGWLLLEESGQATPQSPAGALWRSERALFIGDPLQVQPVVQIEDKLSDVLLDKNGVSKSWSSTMLSAQEIADRVNPYGTTINLGEKKWVGMPLRVHRRCDEPMFSISNRIAYDGFMIFGKNRVRELSSIEKTIGKTSWFNVEGKTTGESHWIPEEGEVLIELLAKICNKEENVEDLPKLYIITPFKNISSEIKRLLKNRIKDWCYKNKNISQESINKWIENSIGTIHSFQGEETDSVFLVLGGNISKPGAISWVSDEPNILNVATTRAKHSFYIIGNRKVWNKGVFGLINNIIKTK